MQQSVLFSPTEFFVNTPLVLKENDEHAPDFVLHLSRIFRCALNRACHSNTGVQLMLSARNAFLIIARVSVAFFPRFAHNLSCSFVGSIAKPHQARCTTPNKRTYKISTSTQLRKILYTDSKDMLILSSTVASRYYNCCTDGSFSPGNYGYPIVLQKTRTSLKERRRKRARLKQDRVDEWKTWWTHRYIFWFKKQSVAVLAEEQLPEDN
jgi:hypothetical protein